MIKLKNVQSPPAWVAWIEIVVKLNGIARKESPPAWVAWIEIPVLGMVGGPGRVATRMGGVD